jgi:hypothetical protein
MRVFIALQRRLGLRVSGILFLSISSPIIVGENRDLAVSHERIGHVLSAQGDLTGALHAYRQSLEILQRLAESDPTNAGRQRDVCISCWRMAEIAERAGTGDAGEWWCKAHGYLADMKQRGIMLPADEPYLQRAGGGRCSLDPGNRPISLTSFSLREILLVRGCGARVFRATLQPRRAVGRRAEADRVDPATY